MSEKEAKDLIKKYVLENFDDKWRPEPLFLEEHPDFYEFGINSKKYFISRAFRHLFVGLGSSYISKKYGEIVQFGSGSAHYSTRRDFLKIEHKLNIVRNKYKLERIDYSYKVVIKNITDEEKASKYIDGISTYNSGLTYKEFQHRKKIEFSFVFSLGLLNLLYFNVIDPFCECTYEKLIFENDSECSQPSYPMDISLEEDTLFQSYMIETIIQQYPRFRIDKCYKAEISEIYNKEKLYQYLPIAVFRYYGEDEPTGFIGYVLTYSHDEIEKMREKKKISFEFAEGKDLLFFLFLNSITPFCKIQIEKTPNKPIINL